MLKTQTRKVLASLPQHLLIAAAVAVASVFVLPGATGVPVKSKKIPLR